MSKLDRTSFVETYERFSQFYDLVYGKTLQGGREALSRAIRPLPAGDVLEFGVGSGLMLPLYPSRFRVVGVDVSPGTLARARWRVQRLGLANVELHLIDAEDTGIPDEAFDHVVLPYVYSVTPSPMHLLREAYRVCRPAGTIWILNHFSGLGLWDHLERPLKPFARWVGFRPEFPFKTYITDLDLDIQSVQAVNWFGLSRLVRVRRSEALPPGLARKLPGHGAGVAGGRRRPDPALQP